MSDQQQEVTVDDMWVNRLANRIGVLTAQNERLMVENEALQQQMQQLQERVEELQGPPTTLGVPEHTPNGEMVEVPT